MPQRDVVLELRGEQDGRGEDGERRGGRLALNRDDTRRSDVEFDAGEDVVRKDTGGRALRLVSVVVSVVVSAVISVVISVERIEFI